MWRNWKNGEREREGLGFRVCGERGRVLVSGKAYK